MPRVLQMDYLKKGLKDYLRITFLEVLGGFLMIAIPTYSATYGLYFAFNLMNWNKYFNPNSDENIQNISADDSERYLNSRAATIIITISFYIAGRACSINFADNKQNNDFINDENLLVIEEKE